MQRDFNTNTANHDEWLTPQNILSALGPFDLDPCAPINRPWDMAARHYTVADDGLSKPWAGRSPEATYMAGCVCCNAGPWLTRIVGGEVKR